MNRDHLDKAERQALARALKLWPSPAVKSDGVDTVRAALDDVTFLRELAGNLFAEAIEDGEDDGVIGRMVRARIHASIRNQPDFAQNVGAELADLTERACVEVEEDEAFECNAPPTFPQHAAS